MAKAHTYLGCLYLGIRVILCRIKTLGDINLKYFVFWKKKGQRLMVMGHLLQCENAGYLGNFLAAVSPYRQTDV